MRYRLYKLKEVTKYPKCRELAVHDTLTGGGWYLYADIFHDYFKRFLSEGVPNYAWDFKSEIRLTHYDLIEEFDNPKDSIIIKEEYENILWGKRVVEMRYHLIVDYYANGDSRFNFHVNGTSYLFVSGVKYSRLNLNPNLSDSEIINILNESVNSCVCSETFFDFRDYFKTEVDRYEYYKFKKLSELLEFIEERILIEELKK